MTAENLVQIDLSEDSSWDQVDDSLLTDEDKAVLREHFTEESEGIIQLTREELQELKNILNAPGLGSLSPEIQSETVAGDIDSFVQQQISEGGISISDLLSEDSEMYPIMEALHTQAQESLFGNEGIFRVHTISENAQNTLSTSLTLSVIELISQQDMQNMSIAQIGERFSQEIQNASLLEEAANMTHPGPGGNLEQVPALIIAGGGEHNTIFMDSNRGQEFFTNLLSGSISSAQELVLQITEANASGEVEVVFPESFSGESIESLEAVLAQVGQQAEVTSGELDVSPAEIPEDPVERQNYIDRLKQGNFLEKMLAAIFEALENLGLYSESDNETDTETEREEGGEGEEVISPINSLRSNLLSRVREGAFSSVGVESLIEFFNDDQSLHEFMNILEEIPTLGEQDTILEKVENLFFSPISSDESILKIDAFVTAGRLEDYKNADGSLSSENLLSTMRTYKDYRQAYNSEETTLTYESYFTYRSE